MIGRIAGRIVYRSTDHVLVDVQGVGYIVYCSDRTLAGLPGNGEAVALFTDLLVREDILQLFGFETLLEKEWYRLLTSVQGIGAKASLSILSTLGPDGVSRAITLGDWGALKAAKGIGPKTAQRVVNELKDKAPAVMALGGTLSEAIYFLTFGCVVFRVLLFNEQSDCLLDTCTPSMQQKYISLVANVILWSVAEERKPVKVGKPAGKVNPTGKIKNTVKLLRPDQVVLDLSGTKNFGFRKRVTGKIRLV